MRLVTLALLTACGIAVAAPAMAEDVIVGGRVGGVGVGVNVDGPRHYRDHDRVVVHEGYARAHCKTVIIHDGNVTKKIKRCD
jgi:hypothetical protein